MVQFDESSDEYRCCCDCFHVKIGAMIIAGAELAMLLFFLINSVLLIAQRDTRYESAAEVGDGAVIGPFIACMIGLSLGVIVVLLLLIGIIQKLPILLLPHLVVQGISIIAFILLLVCGALAISTDTTIFYRLLNAAPFNEHPGRSTVALDTETTVRIYVVLAVYAICLLLQCWFIVVIYNCYRYLTERCAYMRYCQAYSTPMKTLSPR